MSTPEIRVNDSELVEPLVVHAERRHSEWLMMLREAWRMGRTKIGVAICAAIVALAVIGPWVAPYSPTEFVVAPAPAKVQWRGAARAQGMPQQPWNGVAGHEQTQRQQHGADGIQAGLQVVPAYCSTARLTTPATMHSAPVRRALTAASRSSRAPKKVPTSVASSRAGATWLTGAMRIAYSTRM